MEYLGLIIFILTAGIMYINVWKGLFICKRVFFLKKGVIFNEIVKKREKNIERVYILSLSIFFQNLIIVQ